MDTELSTFLPADAARITGVSAELQRGYRKRQLLPSHGGKDARHELFALGKMFFLKALFSFDFPMSEAVDKLAEGVATAIARRALEMPQAWEPCAELAGVDLAELAVDVVQDYSPLGPAARALNLERYFVLIMGTEQAKPVPFYASVDAALTSEAAFGPAFVLDTQLTAEGIVARAGRPLARVSEAIPFEAFSRPARVLAN